MTRSWGSYLLVVLGAMVIIVTLYPPLFFTGTGRFFQDGDVAQHVSGWLFYRTDSWHWPLLHTQRLLYPEGVDIFRTDSIPIAALISKVLDPLLPQDFHYFAIWHVISRLCAGIAMAFLLRSLKVDSAFAIVCGGLIAVIWPSSLFRLDHSALTTHAVIVVALAVYARARNDDDQPLGTLVAFALTILVSLLVHPYLAAMSAAIALAWTFDQVIRRRSPLGLLWLPGVLALVAVLAWPFGYWGVAGGFAGGYDFYSMNLASPFCGGGLIPCAVPNATGGQYEGFNLLGAGVLLTLLAAVVLAGRQSLALVRRYPGLVIVCVGLTVYALSYRVFLFDRLLLTYGPLPVINFLTGIFRASGRFFWPVGYALFALALAALAMRGRRFVMPVVALALVLQWIDTQPMRQAIWTRLSESEIFDFQVWASAFPNTSGIEVYPVYCYPDVDTNQYTYFQLLAATQGWTVNAGYLAHQSGECELDQSPPQPDLDPHTIYISPVGRSQAVQSNPFFRSADATGRCRVMVWRDMLVCSADPDADWAQLDGVLVPSSATISEEAGG